METKVMEPSAIRRILSRDLTDTIIRIGLIGLLAVACIQVVLPFASLILWALILAIALYPLHCGVSRRLGGRQGAAASIIVLSGLLLIGTPTVLLGGSFAGRVHDAYERFQDDTITLPKPNPAVARWPIVGDRLYDAWDAAAEDLPAFIQKNKVQLETMARQTVKAAASTAGSVAMYLAALIVSGIMMAYGDAGSQALQRIFSRMTDADRGPRLQRLSTATVRSVASGVIGVAFIQALLLGVGFLMAGIPAAGVLSFVVMMVGILQLPALLISLPVIGYMWWMGDGSTTANVVWTVYLIIAGMADNVLKPLLLGRGVDAPMPVILIGALGGMVWSGIIGLFVGAVLLAVGYQLFMEWVDHPLEPIPPDSAGVDATGSGREDGARGG
jgi:predicted PurR-regulated permease PerM